MQMKKKLIVVMIVGILFMLSIVAGKKYLDKKSAEKEYQDGVELIQNYVTDYLVHNYEGIEKIEWQGVGIEWRNSPIYGTSLFGNYVNSKVKIFVSKDNYFTVRFTLTDETDYNNVLKRYVESNSLNPENTDFSIKSDLENTIYSLSQVEKEEFNKLKKSSKGSQDAKVVYNLSIHELKH
ncbi:Conserved exported hypothetical protein [Carnobacterium divergens]|nr:hypothetical protein [Carnobacterium divergens]SBO16851.1 Conserved exported hypothetical protein [Carnobacterium divergens]